jgi:hypothetical protein
MTRFRSIGTIRFRAFLALLLWLGAALAVTGLLAHVLQNVRTAQAPPSDQRTMPEADPRRQQAQGP